ncbi:MAG: REP-associated tyrosine transposase [Phycisphaerales bacterium]
MPRIMRATDRRLGRSVLVQGTPSDHYTFLVGSKDYRKRLKRREEPEGVRFVTFSCERRLPLLGSAAIRDAFAESLVNARRRFGFQLFTWVVMPEHVHLLIRPPIGTPLDRVLRSLKLSVAERVLGRWKRLNAPILAKLQREGGGCRFWQKGGGFDRNVRSEAEFSRHVRYIHHNPVTRGLVPEPKDWKWSGVRWWQGLREGEIECDPPPGLGWESWRGYE